LPPLILSFKEMVLRAQVVKAKLGCARQRVGVWLRRM